MAQVRIYADFHGLVQGPKTPDRIAVVLDTMGSLRTLANAGIRMREGLPLIVYDESDDTEDLEGHGTAHFEPTTASGGKGWWVVEFDELGVRYVPAGDRTSLTKFNCVSCRNSLLDVIKAKGLQVGDVCPACGTPIHAPIAPPPIQPTA